MARIIYLRSPYMRGPDVLRLQRALANNPFDDGLKRTDPGPLDGIAGPLTMRAARLAKYWLGYREPEMSAGALLVSYLAKERPLTPAMRARRVERMERFVENTTLAERIYKIAVAELGTAEAPSNVNKYTRWWFGGRDYPIGNCSIFASWCAAQAGSTEFYPCRVNAVGGVVAEGFSDYSEEMLVAARSGQHGLRVITSPVQGCLIVWQWDAGGTDHTSVFEKRSAGKVTSIDANVYDADKRRDAVCRRTRPESAVVAYLLPTK